MAGNKSRKRKHVGRDLDALLAAEEDATYTSAKPNRRPQKQQESCRDTSAIDSVCKRKKKKNKKKRRTEEPEKSSLSKKVPQKSSAGENSDEPTSHPRSLASRLKHQRGTAASTSLPPEWSGAGRKSARFLTPDDGDDFRTCHKECYRGLSWEDPDTLPPSLHASFSKAFDELNNAGLFLYDAVQPGGKRLTLTSVKRTLIGAPGSTYRYLGLRLFSHPWCEVDSNGDGLQASELNGIKRGSTLIGLGYQHKCAGTLLRVGEINATLVKRSKTILRDEIAPAVPGGLVGSAEYNLTLVNRMEPAQSKKDLKVESLYGMGKTSVSWHKDSGLQDFSSIAVYHALQDYDTIPSGKGGEPWRVAVRVASDKVKTPALSIPLPTGSLYYLLDDFNHQHEHAVLSGSEQLRYSSTHRVAREGRGTWQYIRDRCKDVLSMPSLLTDEAVANCTTTAKRKQLVKQFRTHQKLMTEIEFEWLRQWHVQGRAHADLHPYWHMPIQKLISSYEELERRSASLVSLLTKAASAPGPAVSEDLFDVAIEAAEERRKLRLQWQERLRDPVFMSIPSEMRPIHCPILDRDTTNASKEMPHNLDKFISNLRKWRACFLQGSSNEGVAQGDKKKMRSDAGALTKKEQKRVPSNWERMKAVMAKKGSG